MLDFIYNVFIKLIIPFLKFHKRIKEGYNIRIQKENLEENCALWIHSASGGEAFLVIELLKHIKFNKKILLTSNTKEGKEELEKHFSKETNLFISYFIFDEKKIVQKAINHVSPKLVIILETEIWPNFFKELKKQKITFFIINGRLTLKGLKRYLLLSKLDKNFWKKIAPNKIFAISKTDAQNFKKLFNIDVELMSNIKFDRQNFSEKPDKIKKLQEVLDKDSRLIIFASVRKEEEKDIFNIIQKIYKLDRKHKEAKKLIIAIFPKKLERIKYWQKKFKKNYYIKSKIKMPIKEGIIIWDTFGELNAAYHLAKAAFIGGSLYPLGGQNFLEALNQGIVPVCGPYWDNFFWVGKEIVEKNMLIIKSDKDEISKILFEQSFFNIEKEIITDKVKEFLSDKKGGSKKIAQIIEKHCQ